MSQAVSERSPRRTAPSEVSIKPSALDSRVKRSPSTTPTSFRGVGRHNGCAVVVMLETQYSENGEPHHVVSIDGTTGRGRLGPSGMHPRQKVPTSRHDVHSLLRFAAIRSASTSPISMTRTRCGKHQKMELETGVPSTARPELRKLVLTA